MYEYWRDITYSSMPTSVFPTEEWLDEMWIHDTSAREHVKHALTGLLNDFNQFLIDSNVYDWFYSNAYERVRVNNECLLFY
jgi:hypothetical protein